mgnify:CR=1 FL=1
MLKITGGLFRGREIQSPGGATRPTHAKLRSAWFNSLQGEIEGARVLDLFSGSGILGFEALSRGAESVVFVEKDRGAIRVILGNADALGVRDTIILVHGSFGRAKLDQYLFNLVFADPPYGEGLETQVLAAFADGRLILPGGKLCLETGKRTGSLPERQGGLVKTRDKIYGDSMLTTYVYVNNV